MMAIASIEKAAARHLVKFCVYVGISPDCEMKLVNITVPRFKLATANVHMHPYTCFFPF
jgi:hypothetical protein